MYTEIPSSMKDGSPQDCVVRIELREMKECLDDGDYECHNNLDAKIKWYFITK